MAFIISDDTETKPERFVISDDPSEDKYDTASDYEAPIKRLVETLKKEIAPSLFKPEAKEEPFRAAVKGIEETAETAAGIPVGLTESAIAGVTGSARLIESGYKGLAAGAGYLMGGGTLEKSAEESAQAITEERKKGGYEPHTSSGKIITEIPSTALELARTGAGYIAGKWGSVIGPKTEAAFSESAKAGIDIVATLLGAKAGFKAEAAGIARKLSIKETPLSPKERVFAESHDKGYVADLLEIDPESKIGLLGGMFAAKTKRNAINSTINSETRGQDIRNDFGLGEGTTIMPHEYEAIREKAAQSTEKLTENVPVLKVKDNLRNRLNGLVEKESYMREKYGKSFEGPEQSLLADTVEKIKRNEIPTKEALRLISNLRQSADHLLSPPALGGRVSPTNKSLGQFKYQVAEELHNLIEDNLPKGSKLLDDVRADRRIMAKSYTAQAATNSVTGEIIPSKLVRLYDKKGEVFDGGIKRAAEHAKTFKHDNKDISTSGGASPLTPWEFALGFGEAAAGHPYMAIAQLGLRGTGAKMLSKKGIQKSVIRQEALKTARSEEASAAQFAESEKQTKEAAKAQRESQAIAEFEKSEAQRKSEISASSKARAERMEAESLAARKIRDEEYAAKIGQPYKMSEAK